MGAVTVRCQGEEHRVVAEEDGSVRMLDHDVEAEMALLALADRAVEPPVCVQVYLLLSTVSLVLSENGTFARSRVAYCRRGHKVTGRVIGLDHGWIPSEEMWDVVVPLLKEEPWLVRIERE